MIEYEEDTSSNNVEISNAADWVRFNSTITQKSDDPFSLEGEEILKLSGLSPALRRKASRDIQKKFVGTLVCRETHPLRNTDLSIGQLYMLL